MSLLHFEFNQQIYGVHNFHESRNLYEDTTHLIINTTLHENCNLMIERKEIILYKSECYIRRATFHERKKKPKVHFIRNPK